MGAVERLGAGEQAIVELSACYVAFPVRPQVLVSHDRNGRVADSEFSSVLAGGGRHQSQPQSLPRFVAAVAHIELAERTGQSAHGTMRVHVHPSMKLHAGLGHDCLAFVDRLWASDGEEAP